MESLSREDIPLEEFKHTIPELQDAVNKIMVKDVKIDVCIDRFLDQLEEIQPKSYSGWGYLPDFDSFKGKDAQKLQKMKKELEDNLRRLVPGYLEDGFDLFAEGKQLWRLRGRWGRRSGVQQKRKRDDRDSDLFRGSLLPMLKEQHYRQRTGQVEAEDPNLGPQAFTEVCQQLKESIEGERASASFACGGTISIGDNKSIGSPSSPTKRTSPPVSLLWATGHDSNARKLVLPLQGTTRESSQEVLEQLVADCDPATFGRGDQDILDPKYRKAGKIDSNDFASGFHPSDFGIIENVEQILLPSVSAETENRLQFRKLSAELYKLNIYSGPSGLFRKHVDTPRAENQIGSLVVCLPSAFKGGNLLVRHHGQTVKFDWSAQSGSVIQWAAFYSDCEHEIEKITEGHRITLTYNLYVTEPVGGVLLSNNTIVQPETLPLYTFVKDVLAKPEFMKQGAVLGIFCSHAYPHSSELAQIQLPRALKGSDLVLYAVFKSLGMEVDVLPILERDGKYGPGNPQLGIKGKTGGPKDQYFDTNADFGYSAEMTSYLTVGKELDSVDCAEIIPSYIKPEDATGDDWWKMLLMCRQPRGWADVVDFVQDRELPIDVSKLNEPGGARIGTRRRPYFTSERGQEEDVDDVANEIWPAYYLPGITWITEPKHEEMAFTQISYGNEAGIGTRYSCAAILAVVPPFDKRKLPA